MTGLQSSNADDFNLLAVCKFFISALEFCALKDATFSGIVVIIDYNHFGFSHSKKIDLGVAKNFIAYLQVGRRGT